MPATALIADADAKSRDRIRRAIDGLVRVVGEADLDEVAFHRVQVLSPDLLLIDLDLPVTGGIATTRRIKAERPGTRVILLTAHGEEAYLDATGMSGADAILPKRLVRTHGPALLRRLAGWGLPPIGSPFERRR